MPQNRPPRTSPPRRTRARTASPTTAASAAPAETRVRSNEDLQIDPRNANRGTPRGRHLLDASLREYGAGRAVLTDRDGVLIAGNKTFEVAQRLGIPTRVIETDGQELVVVRRRDLHLASDPKARALAIADNRVGELDLDWDPAILQQLQADGLDLDLFWTTEEFERLLGEGTEGGQTDENAVVAPGATDIVRGDLFALGRHRLLCGDATDPADVHHLLEGQVPGLMVTDPPYGVAYDPAWRHRMDPRQRTAVGRVANDDRVDWRAAFALFGGDVAYVWHAGLFAGPVAAALQSSGFALRSQVVWVKQHFALSRGDMHWAHEPCWYAVRQGRPSHWQGDRRQTTVWDVPNLNPFGGSRDGENAVSGHGTQKPVRLWERPILHHTTTRDTLYDPFCGSGTAVIAAEKTGRTCVAMDLDPQYIHVTRTRWEAFTGQRARALPGGRRATGGSDA